MSSASPSGVGASTSNVSRRAADGFDQARVLHLQRLHPAGGLPVDQGCHQRPVADLRPLLRGHQQHGPAELAQPDHDQVRGRARLEDEVLGDERTGAALVHVEELDAHGLVAAEAGAAQELGQLRVLEVHRAPEVDGPALAGHPPCRRGDRDVGRVARAERDEARRALEPDGPEHRRVGGVAGEDRDAVRPQRGDAGAVRVLVDTDDRPAVLGQRQRQPGARGTQAADDGVPTEAAEPVALELLTEHHGRGLEQRAHRHQRRREPGHLQAPVQVAAAAAVGEHGELESEVQVVEERPVSDRRLRLRHEPGEAQDDEHHPARQRGGTTGGARPTGSPRAAVWSRRLRPRWTLPGPAAGSRCRPRSPSTGPRRRCRCR